VRFANSLSAGKAHLEALSAQWTPRNAVCAPTNLEALALRKVEILPDFFESWKSFFGQNPRTILIIGLLEKNYARQEQKSMKL